MFELIRAQVTPRTRLIAISAVSWLDGKVFPWRELREATQRAGARRRRAVRRRARRRCDRSADFYTVSAQKWLCGPDATGALYVRDPDVAAAAARRLPERRDVRHRRGHVGAEVGRAPLRHDVRSARRRSPGSKRRSPSSRTDGSSARGSWPSGAASSLLERGHDVVSEPGQGTLVSFRFDGDTAEAAAALYERGVIVRELAGTGLLRASVGWWNDDERPRPPRRGAGGALGRGSAGRPSSPAIGCSAATTFVMCSSSSSPSSSAPS